MELPDPRQVDDNRHFVMAACGEHFTLLLSDQGFLYSTGSSEFGQLGNGATGEHIAKANKISFMNCDRFERRSVFVAPINDTTTIRLNSEEKLTTSADSSHIRLSKISCGKNHAIAIEAEWD